jgi:hypothetical protein
MLIRESLDNTILNKGNDSQFIEYPWWMMNSGMLNKRYFDLSLQKFTYLNTHSKESNKLWDESDLRMRIEPMSREGKAGRKWRALLWLENKGQDTICSALSKNGNYVFTKWYLDATKTEVQNTDTLYLLADLLPSMQSRQLIQFHLPGKKGDYLIKYFFHEKSSALEHFIGVQRLVVN